MTNIASKTLGVIVCLLASGSITGCGEESPSAQVSENELGYAQPNDRYFHAASCSKLGTDRTVYDKNALLKSGYEACPECQPLAQMPAKPDPTPAPASAAQEPIRQPGAPRGPTLAQYQRLRDGMSYEEVVGIIGFQGQPASADYLEDYVGILEAAGAEVKIYTCPAAGALT